MGNMQLGAIRSNQINMSGNVNAFGHPMKKQIAKAVDPMANLNQKREIRKQLLGMNNQNNKPVNSVLDSSNNYLQSLREARNKEKNAVLEKKRLKYSYKSISSKIINCKKSYNAKEAISLAKREIARLKKLRGKEGYDLEELEAAIAHAQSMERVAKKKARHLEEEEMAKASGGACIGDREIEEEVKDEDEEFDIEDLDKNSDEELPKLEEYDIEEFDYGEELSIEEIEDVVSEMSEEFEDIMNEMGIDELFEDMGVSSAKDMDPADLKMMKIKHRTKEMKEIAKADNDYLKVIFEKLERDKAAVALAVKNDAPSMNVSIDMVSSQQATLIQPVAVEMPSIDISI